MTAKQITAEIRRTGFSVNNRPRHTLVRLRKLLALLAWACYRLEVIWK